MQLRMKWVNRNYGIYITNPCFEFWLLMHFDDVKELDPELLLENPKFPQLLNLIRIYFEDTVALGMMSRNDMINMATTSLTEYMQQNPAHKEEVKHDIRLLNAQKFGEHEAEMERIKSIFLSILREIKSDIANHHMPEQTAN